MKQLTYSQRQDSVSVTWNSPSERAARLPSLYHFLFQSWALIINTHLFSQNTSFEPECTYFHSQKIHPTFYLDPMKHLSCCIFRTTFRRLGAKKRMYTLHYYLSLYKNKTLATVHFVFQNNFTSTRFILFFFQKRIDKSFHSSIFFFQKGILVKSRVALFYHHYNSMT